MKHKTLTHTQTQTQTNPRPSPSPSPTSKSKKMTRFNSSPLPICFRPSTTTHSLDYPHAPPSTAATTTTTSTPYLSTCLYQTHLGIFALTWSHTLFSRSFHLTLHSPPPQPPPSSHSLSSSSSLPSFHLTLKPFIFWNKHGVKKLSPSLSIFWDLSRAQFGPGLEPTSGFYIALLHEGEIILLIGDMEKEAIAKMKPNRPGPNPASKLVIRREHVFGARFYSTTTEFGGQKRNILIELNNSTEPGCTDDPRLVIRVDNKRVLQVKHLKWKFRGSERVELDGTHIQLSWDIYNWLFDEQSVSGSGSTHNEDAYALFTFRFEEDGNEEGQNWNNEIKGGVIWSQDLCGLNYERKKMKKKMLTKSIGGSSSSISSVSSGSSSSVLEWESVEENELKGPTGFSLLLYAWKS